MDFAADFGVDLGVGLTPLEELILLAIASSEHSSIRLMMKDSPERYYDTTY